MGYTLCKIYLFLGISASLNYLSYLYEDLCSLAELLISRFLNTLEAGEGLVYALLFLVSFIRFKRYVLLLQSSSLVRFYK